MFLTTLVYTSHMFLFFFLKDIIHKFTRDKYSKRFPELESLVPDALDYIRTVKVGFTQQKGHIVAVVFNICLN